MFGTNVSKETEEVNALIDVENTLPVPRASCKRAAPNVVYQPENLPTRRTKRQRLVATDESSDEESEPASKSRSKSSGKVTDGGKQNKTPAKAMGIKGSGISRSSSMSRRSSVVRVKKNRGA